MALRTAQQIGVAPALVPAYTAPAASDTVAPDDRVFLHVKTAGTGTTVTIPTPSTYGGFAIADASYVLGTTAEQMIGPLTAALFADPTTGLITVNYSSVTTVTHAFLRV